MTDAREQIGASLSSAGHSQACKIARLKQRSEFVSASSGRKFHTPRLSAQIKPRSDQDGLRVGFTITKKVGNSVVRNRIRRRLRAAVSQTAEAIASTNVDVVFIGRHDALMASFETLTRDVAAAFGRALREADGFRRKDDVNAPD